MPCTIRVQCPICGREITKTNIERHIKSHENSNGAANKYLRRASLDKDTLRCCFCGRVCQSPSGLGRHQVSCSKNPNRLEIHRPDCKDRISWNKGLTKDTDERVAQGAEKRNQFYQTHPRPAPHPHSKETKDHLRQLALDRGLGGHCYKHAVEYNGIRWDSSYEVKVAQSLDSCHVRYLRPGRFSYRTPDGSQHTYTPDFYLPDYDIYLDPKSDFLINNINPALGYKDTYKIELASQQNHIRVLILDKEHLSWDVIEPLIREFAEMGEYRSVFDSQYQDQSQEGTSKFN